MKEIANLIREFPMGAFIILMALAIGIGNGIESCGKHHDCHHHGDNK